LKDIIGTIVSNRLASLLDCFIGLASYGNIRVSSKESGTALEEPTLAMRKHG